MDDELLSPCEAPASLSRNATRRSVLAEGLVATFLSHGASAASVHWERTGYTLEELHKGLWNVCHKPPYEGVATVSRRDGELILRRIGGRNG